MISRIRILVVLVSALTSLLAMACKVPTKDGQRARIYGSDAPADTIVPDTYFVIFDDNTTDDTLKEAKSEVVALGATIRHTYTHVLRGFSAKMSEDALNAVLRHPQVSFLELVRKATLSGMRTCPDSWGLDRINQRAPTLDGVATDDNGGGAGVTIYVLDSGVRKSHVAFGTPLGTPSRVIGGMCTVVDKCCTPDANGECTFSTDEKDWTDCANHGTFSAAIAAGSLMVDQTPPGKEVGIAYAASIVAVRVAMCTLNNLLETFQDDLVKGLDQVAAASEPRRVALISATLDTYTEVLPIAVAKAISDGVLVVVSAGNDSKDACGIAPGGNIFNGKPNLSLNVGALAQPAGGDQPWSLSNFGTCVDLWAPGQGVTSATTAGCDEKNLGAECSTFAANSGTSFAAAHVAGVAAGLWSKNPDATALTIANYTIGLATPVPNIGPVLFSPSSAVSPADPASMSPSDGCVDGVAQPCYGDSCNFCPSKTRCCEGLEQCGHGLLCFDGECSVCGGAKGDSCCAGQVCRKGFFTCDTDFNVCSCGRLGEPCCGGVDGTCEGALACIDGSCGGCGLEGQQCCAGTCTGAALDCVEDKCKHCGFPGESCCDESCRLPGTTCDPDSRMCTSCGFAGQPCCAGLQCDAQSACVEGQCKALCGGLNEPCCPGDTCDSGAYVCTNGACISCGGLNEPCCSGDSCDSGAYVCANGACNFCGSLNEPCCSGDTCDSGAYVCANGACNFCGGLNEPCCSGDSCDSGAYVCTSGVCSQCGGVNESCCSGNICDSSASVCRDGTCEPCGGPNELCCSGNTCNPGPCAYAPAGEPCVFDTRTLANHPTKGFIEAITAYGRYWEYDMAGYALPGSGGDLSSHPWLGIANNGPCALAPAGQCKLNTRHFTDYYPNFGFAEDVSAYGIMWHWDVDGNPAGCINGCPLVTLDPVPALRFNEQNGPCTFKPLPGQPNPPCVLDTRALVQHPNLNVFLESFTAYGHYFERNEQAGGPNWNWSWGSLDSVPRYSSLNGPCAYAPTGQPCTFDTRSLANHPIRGFIEYITAYGRYWEFDVFGAPIPGNGADLRSVPRYLEYTQ